MTRLIARSPRGFVLAAAMLLAGCRPAAPQPPGGTAAEPAAETAVAKAAETSLERGPVRVHVQVEPHPIRLSDEPKLTLTIEYENGVEIEKPPFGEAIGEFQIRGFHEPLVEVRDDRQILRQIYTLEPTRSGPQRIAPIPVAFVDRRPQGDGQRHTLQTEPLELEVTSVLPEQIPSLDDLQPLAGPVELPEPRLALWPWWLGGCCSAVIAAAGVWWAVKRRRTAPARALSPQELAYLELDQLIAANYAETDVKLFYVHLTGIVRRYIERTTGIHAPEQTTEEFLREIGSSDVFPSDERRRLKDFLQAADLVKFAALEPSGVDLEQTFERAKAFLGLQVREVAA